MAERHAFIFAALPVQRPMTDSPSRETVAAIDEALDTLALWCTTCAAADTLHGVAEGGPTADLLWNSMQAVIAALYRVHDDVPHEFHLARGTLQAIELYLCAYVQREPGENDHGMWALEVPTTLRGAAAYAGRLLAGLWVAPADAAPEAADCAPLPLDDDFRGVEEAIQDALAEDVDGSCMGGLSPDTRRQLRQALTAMTSGALSAVEHAS